MFPTVEVRWFRRGQAPRHVAAWFHRGKGGVDRRPRRVDHYLRLNDYADLSIKLREGRIEVKQRFLRQDGIRFHPHVTGAVEHWRKWSFQLADAQWAQPGIAALAESWAPVSKERLVRTYRLTAEGRVVPATTPCQGGDILPQACVMELTAVRVGEQDWWTLAFEAFGDEAHLEELLHVVARHVLAADEPPILNAAESCGYAEWLGIAARSEDTM